MRKLTQTRLHNPPIRGNCFPTVIACFLDLKCAEDALQIQEHYDEDDWNIKLYDWLLEKGWEWSVGDGHLFNDEFYLVSGESPRNSKVTHVCIYQNGKLWHDPHPDSTGIVTEKQFECLNKVSKVCFKCNKMKPLTEYYSHKQMSDGLLGKCKTCTKEDSKKQTEIKTSTPEGLEKERERHRDKYHRLGYKDVHKPAPEVRYEATVKHRLKYPEKWKATVATRSLKRGEGNHLHHWSYNEQHRKDCIEMDADNHSKLHRFIEYDPITYFYSTREGVPLDTKEKHLEYINKLGIQTN